MNIIGRAMILLAAALVVVGITWMLAPAGNNRNQPTLAQSQASSSADTSAASQRAVPPRRERGEGRGVFGIFEVFKNLIIVAVIAGLTLLGMRVVRRAQASARHE